MRDKKRMLKTAHTMLQTADSTGAEFDMLCFTVWSLLPSEARDTLRALCTNGPLWDGNVPSKNGRDTLINMGFASKAVVKGEHGFQVANYLGWAVYASAAENSHE